jgi:hypothetical protein
VTESSGGSVEVEARWGVAAGSLCILGSVPRGCDRYRGGGGDGRSQLSLQTLRRIRRRVTSTCGPFQAMRFSPVLQIGGSWASDPRGSGATDAALGVCQGICQRRDVYSGALLVGGGRVDLPHLEGSGGSAPEELRPVLLRPALTHKPAIMRSCDQPPSGTPPGFTNMAKFDRGAGTLTGQAVILKATTVLEHHGGVKEVVGSVNFPGRQQLLDTMPSSRSTMPGSRSPSARSPWSAR